MTKSKTKYAVATVAAVAVLGGGLAFAGLTLGRTVSTYQVMTFSCHDGTTVRTPVGVCRTQEAWTTYAKGYCSGRSNPTSGKVGLNSIKLGKQCGTVSSGAKSMVPAGIKMIPVQP